jgi:hypothetical protein
MGPSAKLRREIETLERAIRRYDIWLRAYLVETANIPGGWRSLPLAARAIDGALDLRFDVTIRLGIVRAELAYLLS